MMESADDFFSGVLSPRDRRFVLNLRDAASADPELAGGKAANLAKLLQAGFPVPEGIVVTTSATSAYEAGLNGPEDGGNTAETEEARRGARMRQAALSMPFDPAVKALLGRELERLGSAAFAVRSSGVAEDLGGASFAGQYDTFLDVRGTDEVELAVRKCLASAFSDHLLRYRAEQRIEAGRMAVLIQPMLAPDAAGVAFTVNPVTGHRGEVLISAVRGVGERLVSGLATPDEWTVRGNLASATSTPEQAVDDKQVLLVAELARRTEAFFGAPQDIEWAIRGGELYLLQARPITTLGDSRTEEAGKAAAPAADAESPKAVTASKPMSEVPVDVPEGYWEREASHYPEPLSPATRTTFIPAMNHAMTTMCSEMSLMIESLEQRSIGGWMYQRTVPLGGKDRPAPPAWLMPLLIRVVPSIRSRIAGSVRTVRSDFGGRMLGGWKDELKPALIGRTAQLAGVDLNLLTDGELAVHLWETRHFLGYCLDQHMLMNGALQLALAEYAFACRDWLGWNDAETMLIFSGLSEASSEPAREMSKLALWVRGIPQLARELESGAPLPELQRRYPEFADKISAYLREFGRRALRSELAYPTLAESPGLLARLLGEQVKSGYVPGRDDAVHDRRRRERLSAAEEILASRPEADRLRFKQLLRRAEIAYAAREEHGFYDRDAPFALLRYALLEAGRRLAERGCLPERGDVFLLEFDEIQQALRGERDRSAIRAAAELRQSEMNWTFAHPGPASYGEAPPPPPSFASFPTEARLAAEAAVWAIERIFATGESGQIQTDANRITGISASAGQYTGTVRVVRDESEFGKIEPGDVLVCPITTPAWSILFPNIGALVTDSGGILSHSAIIAREYCIPAVVATGNATALLLDGQRVTVDGIRGIIEPSLI
ncbi:PEP/pyruvate-binding domain-containing protein [Saccharibacillus sp. CPCC 101409]|uniref:PEP/pyruvate-binding domain-containing protein n=1 Tax=Saccharibacillus sp. CPCC 101409 TaxID=3058041 RepID=UPI002671774C|nr:PEP/pyruvate-binding domain-containing protein [Saccharibacillus sp. CPCC 101409]MDO3409864.1 PEP/pyruvate-binding domain-containing protein [Saccharibacillus sp. CPCC 101409]